MRKNKAPEESLFESKEYEKFKQWLEQSKRVLISTHQLPDGDGLGAEYALYHYLKKAKKTCRIYNPDALPKRYRFLDEKNALMLGPGEVELWDTCDLWLIVDTNDPRRVGKIWNEMSNRSKKIVFLDHHPPTQIAGEAIVFPPHAMVVADTSASSIGEMLHRLFRDLNLAKLNEEIALGLYVSVMTDTNSFRYARTTPEAHRIAAEMLEHGINPEEIYQNIFSSKDVSHLHLLGTLLQTLKVSSGGKLAWMEIPLDLRKKHRASADDTLSFLNLLLLLKDSEVVCLFREEDEGHVRVSMKSKGKVIINRVAMDFGGGGHEYAAGVAIDVPFEKAVQQVTSRLDSVIDSYLKFGK